MKVPTIIIAIVATIFSISCVGYPSEEAYSPSEEPIPAATPSPPESPPTPEPEPSGRTIVLDGESMSEEEYGEFISWIGRDYNSADNSNSGPVLVEVGFFSDPDLAGAGFVLYDGGVSGTHASYSRRGLYHRWDWGPKGNEYSIEIDLDGIGEYYDNTAGSLMRVSSEFFRFEKR